jgi:hypothetical protein
MTELAEDTRTIDEQIAEIVASGEAGINDLLAAYAPYEEQYVAVAAGTAVDDSTTYAADTA